MKKSEVHKMSDAEMTEEVARLRKQLFELKCQAVTEKIENPRQLGNIKRDIARILTEQRQRQLQESK
ncbi:50S ribosomal protein L29 [Poriferisphaera corsica]|uniref:Large ribosomal subunit protein uL29 n=1 Tax=Poriferisphaera corsica TaxID=2528020 RepID=A0A517YT30_9BACT|nr:50S ribosomal protein L29 [Poriferisphaera corsica]QDU33368.1 50S ribosomal protein L29 [Poriferisphaera corsica]